MLLNVNMIVNKIKSISQSYLKTIKFDEHKNCLDGKDFQKECDKYVIRSLNHEKYL